MSEISPKIDYTALGAKAGRTDPTIEYTALGAKAGRTDPTIEYTAHVNTEVQSTSVQGLE